jgi:hypothetical protein
MAQGYSEVSGLEVLVEGQEVEEEWVTLEGHALGIVVRDCVPHLQQNPFALDVILVFSLKATLKLLDKVFMPKHPIPIHASPCPCSCPCYTNGHT